jgi:hypothetical protein
LTCRGCGYGYAYAYAYGGSYACSYCNHTLYPQAASEFYIFFNEVDFRFSQIATTTIYLLVCFVVSFPASPAAPPRAAMMIVLASGLPP